MNWQRTQDGKGWRAMPYLVRKSPNGYRWHGYRVNWIANPHMDHIPVDPRGQRELVGSGATPQEARRKCEEHACS